MLPIRNLCSMALRCPPELLLRNAVRHLTVPKAPRFSTTAGRSSFKAAMCTELGKPLSVQTLKSEPLEPGLVRVDVHAAAVNFGDILVVKGQYQERPPLPFIPGNELAGMVSEAGPSTSFKLGDRVVGVTGTQGAFTQQADCKDQLLWKIPDGISYSQAAATIVSYATAWMALKRRVDVREGETVLVTAAAGAVGLASVDLAANVFKCKVIGACGSEDKCNLVKSKGAVAAINYNKESMRDRVKEITGGKGADIIVENVGGKAFTECLRCLAFEGRILVIGFAGGEIQNVPANILLVKSCSAVGVYWGSYAIRLPEAYQESVNSVLQLLGERKINPHYSKEFPLEQVNEAIQYVLDRKSTGKVILHPR